MPGVRALRAPAILALVLPVLAGPDAKAYAEAAQSGDAAKQKDVGAALQAIAGPDPRIDFDCPGFAVPAGLGKDGPPLPAPQLAAHLYNWHQAPVPPPRGATGDPPAPHRLA